MVEEPKITATRPEIGSESIPTAEIPVFIKKSNFYRVVHADGVYGGGTPTPGNIMMTVFSHRVPFPEKIVNDGTGHEVLSKREAKFGMEQEFEVSLVMNLDTAKCMLIWLTNAINNVEVATQLNQLIQKK